MDQKNLEVENLKTIYIVEIGYHTFEFTNPVQAFQFYATAVNHGEKDYTGRVRNCVIYAKYVIDEENEDESEE